MRVFIITALSIGLFAGVVVSQSPPRKDAASRIGMARLDAIAGFSKLPKDQQAQIYDQFKKQLADREARMRLSAAAAVKLAESVRPNREESRSALLGAGMHCLDAGEWKAAKRNFSELCDQHPDLLAAQEARLFLFDMAIELDLDLQQAREALQPAVAWAYTIAQSKPPKGAVVYRIASTIQWDGKTLPLQPPGPSIERFAALELYKPRTEGQVAAEVLLREALIWWFDGDIRTSVSRFQDALPLDPSANGFLANLGRSLLGKPIGSKPSTDSSSPSGLGPLIAYAELVHSSKEWYRVHRIWDSLARKPSEQLTDRQRSQILFRRAEANSHFLNPLEIDTAALIKDLQASYKLESKASWSDDCLLIAGNLAWNSLHDDKLAQRLWKTIIDDHTGGEHATRAAYFVGVVHEQKGRFAEARTAYQAAKKKFPASTFNKLIDEHLQKLGSKT